MYKINEKQFNEMPQELKALYEQLPNPTSDEVVSEFPDSNGQGKHKKADYNANQPITMGGGQVNTSYTDKGSAARFFYCAKASKKDRNEGLDDFEATPKLNNRIDQKLMKCSFCNKYKIATDFCKCIDPQWKVNKVGNNHPTVKPTALMKYLVRLVTPKGGTCLDPFMGSGSTGKACVLEGFDFIGIELDTEYCKIAQARIDAVK